MCFHYEKTRPWLRGAALLAGLVIVLAPGLRASTRVNLDGFWRFKTDSSNQGESAGWAQKMPSGTEMVRVPGTWSVIRKYYYYVGAAWYFRKFAFPRPASGQRIELHFGATFYKSRVWLNGKELGGHEGGYTSYFFNLAPYLKPVNYLAVEINTEPSMETIPGWSGRDSPRPGRWYDWWPDGGIVRDVWLKISSPRLLRWQQILTSVSGNDATITDNLHIENYTSRTTSAGLRLQVRGPDGEQAASSSHVLSLAPGPVVLSFKLQLDGVKLWSFDNPNLYRMQAVLTDHRGDVLDSLSNNFGVRSIEIRSRRLYLNGQVVRLTGIDRHEDSPWEGLAESEGTILHDYDDLKKLQVTLTRPVHYPQNPRIYDFCDRHGILLIPEIPLWHFGASQLADPNVVALAKQMMREVIEQDANHPSIFAWSVCNESATNTPQGVAYFRTMVKFIKSLDPSRYVTYADDLLPLIKSPSENAASYADFVMWNEYYGSGHGPISALPGLIEKIGKDYPDKMVIISETAPYTAMSGDRKEAQQFRDASIGKELALFGKYPWIGGALYWCYQPYRSHAFVRRTTLNVPVPAPLRSFGNFGFVNQDRERQPLYFAFQKHNSPAKLDLRLFWPGDETSVVPPSGFSGTIERRGANQIPSYPLDDYQAAWQALDDRGTEVAAGQQTLPDIGPPETLRENWKPPAEKIRRLTVHFWLYRPTGFLAAKGTCWWRPPIWRLGIWRCSNTQ